MPGWDCHGLPIEWKIEEQYRAKGLNKDDVDVVAFRQECRRFAEGWIDVQRVLLDDGEAVRVREPMLDQHEDERPPAPGLGRDRADLRDPFHPVAEAQGRVELRAGRRPTSAAAAAPAAGSRRAWRARPGRSRPRAPP